MRILLVQESDWLEKGPHQQHHLMEKLSLRGYTIRVIDFEITWNRKPKRRLYSKRKVFVNVSKIYKGSKVVVIRPGILKLPLLDYASIVFTHGVEILKQILEFDPDIIIGFGILNTFIALQIAKRYKIPFIYYLIDALHTLIPFKKLKFIGKILESNILRHSNVICVINEELKRYAIKMGAKPEKIHVVRAGIDVQRFNPDIDGSTIRKKFGLSKDDIVLFFMGWLYPFSGLKELAMKLIEIRKIYPNIRLLIVGEGELHPELQKLKEKHDLQQLILVGWQPYEKVPEYIAASDICLLPAHNNEIMRNIVPIKMYEYMACGKPVIATKLPGILKEFGYNNGVIYVDRPEDVIKKVIELDQRNVNLEEYGVKARKFVDKYSWDRITDQFENILRTLV